jgi:hypothetical protein
LTSNKNRDEVKKLEGIQMDDLTVDYTNTHDWNEAEGRCLRCGMTDCGEPCTIDERASHTHAFNRKGISETAVEVMSWEDRQAADEK